METGALPFATSMPRFVINEGKGPSNEQTAPDLPEVVYPKWQRDDFDSDTLDVHWQFVRRPAPGNYSLTERPGHMRIWTLDGQLFEIRAKNTLLRREEELSYTPKLAPISVLEPSPSRIFSSSFGCTP